VKVLILHQHFNTPVQGGPLRSYYLAKALINHGHHVVVITTRNQPSRTVEDVEGIEVHYLPIAYNNRFGFYKRVNSFMRYTLQSLKTAGSLKDFSLCYAISVPLTVGLTALWFKRFYKIPFIFEVGDLWPEAPVQLGFIKNPILRASLFWLEKLIYRNAESVVALSPAIQTYIEKKTPGKKVWLIPNMADTDFYKPEIKHPALEGKFGVSRKFVVSYIGAVGFANGLDYYLECARASQQAGYPIHFLLCGDGAFITNLKSIADRLKLQNISFLPFQNREGVAEVMNVTDAVFISYKSFPILETGSPNKYFDGLAAGKLILINFGGWIKSEVEETRCGIALDSRYPHDFVKKIEPFLSERTKLQQYQANARKLAESNYARITLSEKYAAIIKNSG